MTEFSNFLVSNAFEASVLALLAFLFIRFAKPQPALRSALWLLVLAKLCMPPVIQHSISLSGACRSIATQVSEWSSGSDPVLERERDDDAPGSDESYEPVTPPETIESDATEPSVALELDSHEPLLLSDVEWQLPLAEVPYEEFPPREFLDEPALGVTLPQPVEATATVPEDESTTKESVASVPPDDVETSTYSWIANDAYFGVFLLWIAGATLVLLRELGQVAAFALGLRRASPAGEYVLRSAREIAGRLGLRRCPRVLILDANVSPLVWALGRVTIVLPASTVRGPGEVLESVLAHELGHVSRRDHWASWLELLESCVFWWLPTFWYTRREFRESADLATDALAIAAVGSPSTYAQSLLTTVEALHERQPLPLTRGMGQKETLVRRLTMIMNDSPSPRLSWQARLTFVLLAALVLPASPALRGESADPNSVELAEANSPAQTQPDDPPKEDDPNSVALFESKELSGRRVLKNQPAQTKPKSKKSKKPKVEDRLTRLEAGMEQILAELMTMRAERQQQSQTKNAAAQKAAALDRSRRDLRLAQARELEQLRAAEAAQAHQDAKRAATLAERGFLPNSEQSKLKLDAKRADYSLKRALAERQALESDLRALDADRKSQMATLRDQVARLEAELVKARAQLSAMQKKVSSTRARNLDLIQQLNDASGKGGVKDRIKAYEDAYKLQSSAPEFMRRVEKISDSLKSSGATKVKTESVKVSQGFTGTQAATVVVALET
ncbi:MAG: M56 family metallopeptidase, partial [Planctomycetota bacterium]